MSDSKIVVALDFSSQIAANNFIQQLDPNLCKLKIGKELFAVGGGVFVEKCVALGFDVFLDLKYYDIPNTVAKVCEVAAKMGVWMINVHTMGGSKMMSAAKESIVKLDHQPILIGVTVLTSMEQHDLAEIGMSGSTEQNVLRLARLARISGLDGVVCSAQETQLIRQEIGAEFCLVTPGIRPIGTSVNDQKRIMTPADALAAGSSYLVIGRPITQSKDPIQTLTDIYNSIK